jgi:predicted aminopeptidase
LAALRRTVRWIGLGVGSTAGLTLLLMGISLLIPGCSVGYVTRQSVAHLRVLAAREAIDPAIEIGKIPEEWIPKIETIRDAKKYGAEVLGLPTKDLYKKISLAPIGPTWIITASPQDALTPVTWWFPVVGRVAYKGYYNKEGAEKLAAELQAEGNDVMMYAASAFSSLGWFNDPIRPSMLKGSDQRLANLVLHESAHSYLYWKGQTDFNESFASFVGDLGAIRYLEHRQGEDCEECRRAWADRLDGPLFGELIQRTVQRLEELYAEPISREEKIRRREEVFDWARGEHGKIEWHGTAYSGFPQRELDNAILLSYRRYGSGQETFEAVLRRCAGDLGAAMGFVRDLGWKELPRRERKTTDPLDLMEKRLAEGVLCSSN